MLFYFSNRFFKFIYLFWEREREREHSRDRKRGGRDRIPSRLRAVSPEPDVGLELTNLEIVT